MFFSSNQIFPILLTNLATVSASTNLFFGTLVFEIKGYKANPEPIRFLKKADALEASALIIGLMACYKEKIDLSELSPRQVLDKIEDIGHPEAFT